MNQTKNLKQIKKKKVVKCSNLKLKEIRRNCVSISFKEID